jgi:hypothetical protein
MENDDHDVKTCDCLECENERDAHETHGGMCSAASCRLGPPHSLEVPGVLAPYEHALERARAAGVLRLAPPPPRKRPSKLHHACCPNAQANLIAHRTERGYNWRVQLVTKDTRGYVATAFVSVMYCPWCAVELRHCTEALAITERRK